MNLDIPTLESERLHLRAYRQADLDAIAASYADEGVAHFIGGVCDRPTAWRRMATILGHWMLRGHGYWALEDKQSGSFLGSVGIWLPEGWPELELGYWLTRDAQGRGLATEAALRARRFAYEELGATTLVSYIHPENGPSQRVAERLGARQESTIELCNFGPHGVWRHPGPATT